jgi:IS605 OrfB family transposase
MKLTIKIKLLPTKEQQSILLDTIRKFNAICNHISQKAFETKTFNQVKLHHLVYKEVRNKFGMSAQFIVRAIAKVSDSYKVNKKSINRFKPYSAVVYDRRLVRFKNLSTASMNTIAGRQEISFTFGNYASLDKNRMCGEADLVYKHGKFFLHVVIEIPDGVPFDPKGVLGVDKGIVNIASTSDGDVFSGKQVDKVRERYSKIRQSLQKAGTKSAKRHLKKIAKKQSRFQRDTNHCISEQIVAKAKDTQRAIALEDLSGIRLRQTVRRADRQRFGNWAFYQLDSFIEYKAKIEGVPVIKVNPRNTSRNCSVCGFVSKSNRKSQSVFSCLSCGITMNADINGAVNIASKAIVNQPIVAYPHAISSPSLELQAVCFS